MTRVCVTHSEEEGSEDMPGSIQSADIYNSTGAAQPREQTVWGFFCFVLKDFSSVVFMLFGL